jgi:hypothetical protein
MLPTPSVFDTLKFLRPLLFSVNLGQVLPIFHPYTDEVSLLSFKLILNVKVAAVVSLPYAELLPSFPLVGVDKPFVSRAPEAQQVVVFAGILGNAVEKMERIPWPAAIGNEVAIFLDFCSHAFLVVYLLYVLRGWRAPRGR